MQKEMRNRDLKLRAILRIQMRAKKVLENHTVIQKERLQNNFAYFDDMKRRHLDGTQIIIKYYWTRFRNK